MITKPTTADAMKLMLQGTQTMAEIQYNGIRVDTGYLGTTIKDLSSKISDHERQLRSDRVWTLWRSVYGEKSNIDSGPQLENIIFKRLGYEVKERTETGRAKTGRLALESIKDLPFLNIYREIKKFKRVRTRLRSIVAETCDGFFHVATNLHTAQTFRSSASFFQNMDKRDAWAEEVVRRCLIPRKGCRMVQIDYGALEWRIGTCKWRDPEMIKYNEAGRDIHTDMASQCYMVPKSQVSTSPGGGMRYCGKNNFVFPKMYGSYHKKIARFLWDDIDNRQLKTKDGTPVKQVLKRKGITELGRCEHGEQAVPGTFEHRIMMVEREFESQFHVMMERQRAFWDDYLTKGYFTMMTGFTVRGVHSRNDLFNYDIQGPGFHCLLWSMNLIQRTITKSKLKSKMTGTVHDDFLADVPEREHQDFLDMAVDAMENKVRKHWRWLIVPLAAEVTAAEPDGSWFVKHPWTKENGQWKRV